jgi:hypothetical protein
MLGNFFPDPSQASPFQPRPGQETLANNVTKVFVLMMFIFSALLMLLMPPVTLMALSPAPAATATGAGKDSNSSSSSSSTGGEQLVAGVDPVSQLHTLSLCLMTSTGITSVIVMYLMYSVVKVGSKIGQKIVVHPQLLPESLPN